jgi:hypothetical protein
MGRKKVCGDVSAGGELHVRGEGVGCVAASEGREAVKVSEKKGGRSRALSELLRAYIEGYDRDGDDRTRAARLVERLWQIAMYGERDSTSLSAIGEILNRIEGKAVERKEAVEVKIEGLISYPTPADVTEVLVEGKGYTPAVR